jgi:hypothetical protein
MNGLIGIVRSLDAPDIILDSENFSQKKVATIDHASEAVTYNHLKVVYF